MYQHARKNRTTVILDPAPEELTDRRIRLVYEYWLSLAGANGLAARQDFDPLAVRSALSHTMLVNVQPDGHLSYRLMGTAIVEKIGRDSTGKSLQGCYVGDDWDEVAETYRQVIQTRRPVFYTSLFRARDDHQQYRYQRLLCPMTQDGSSVDLLLGALSFDRISRDEAVVAAPARSTGSTLYFDARIDSRDS